MGDVIKLPVQGLRPQNCFEHFSTSLRSIHRFGRRPISDQHRRDFLEGQEVQSVMLWSGGVRNTDPTIVVRRKNVNIAYFIQATDASSRAPPCVPRYTAVGAGGTGLTYTGQPESRRENFLCLRS
eukprot:s185_g22.t1